MASKWLVRELLYRSLVETPNRLGDRMTLKNSLLFAFAALTLISNSAGAYIVPGPRQPMPPPYQGGDSFPGYPGQGPDFPFPEDDFGNGGGGYERQEKKVIYLNRRISNETLPLRQLAGIGENYRGYVVHSVVVETRRGLGQAELSLLADGREEDRAYASQGIIELVPRYATVIGQDIRSLQLAVRGSVNIDSITVNLIEESRGGRPGRPGRPDRNMEVPLNVYRRMLGNDRLDLAPYIDTYRLRGYRITEILIDATPVYNTALLDVLVGGFGQSRTLQLDRYGARQSVFPQNAVLGQGGENIMLISRGDLEVRGVTLRLSR